MPAARYISLVDTLEPKLHIESRLGSMKASKYFNLLSRFLHLKISKYEFDKLCIATIGRENIHLHNHLIRSILKKACLSKIPPSRKSNSEGCRSVKMPNGCQKSNLHLSFKDFPRSPRKGRTPSYHRFGDCLSPFGPQGKNQSFLCDDTVPKILEHESTTDLHSVGIRPPLSVEDGEEVVQDSGSQNIYCSSPVRAPLGIPRNTKRRCKLFCNGLASATVANTCQNIGELPDTTSLVTRLEKKLEMEGLEISADSASLLNSALDVYLKKLIKPCLDLVVSKSVDKFSVPIQPGLSMSRFVQKPSASVFASIKDFRTALELNPSILGEDWSLQFEKVWVLTKVSLELHD